MVGFLSLNPLLRTTIYTNDFEQLGLSALNQNKVNYASVIASRVDEGHRRSKNEWKEHLLRDSLGFASWFYTTDMVKRQYLLAVSQLLNKDDFDGLMIYKKAAPEKLPPTAPLHHRIGNAFQQLNWRINPTAKWDIPSTEQLLERSEQLLAHLAETQGKEIAEHATPNVKRIFKTAWLHRSLASGLGMVIGAIFLGLLVPKLNIILTRKRNAQELTQQIQASRPTALRQPIPSPTLSSVQPSQPFSTSSGNAFSLNSYKTPETLAVQTLQPTSRSLTPKKS